MSLFGMNQVKSLDRAVREPTRAVHYLSGGYMLRSWHKASTHAARLGSSVTDDQATSFFIPKKDTHAPLQLPLHETGDPLVGSERSNGEEMRSFYAAFLKGIPAARPAYFKRAKVLRLLKSDFTSSILKKTVSVHHRDQESATISQQGQSMLEAPETIFIFL